MLLIKLKLNQIKFTFINRSIFSFIVLALITSIKLRNRSQFKESDCKNLILKTINFKKEYQKLNY